MERNRFLVLMAISAFIVVYGVATGQIAFVIVGSLLVLATAALAVVQRSHRVGPTAGDVEVSAAMKKLRASVGPVKLDQERIDKPRDILEKK